MNRRSSSERDEGDFRPSANTGYGHAITVVLLIAIAFAVRYWFNFMAPHANNYGSADASEYLRNAQALFELRNLPLTFWNDCWSVLQGQADPALVEKVRQSLTPLKDFYISGPTFPLYLAGAYAIAGGHFDMLNWSAPLMAQSVISALTCGFIALTASLAFSRPTGYLAGLVAAFYPAFIVNSGRLYSETFAAFLLSIVLYFTVRGFCLEQRYGQTFLGSFVTGLCAAALQFTRSVMVIVSVALVPIAFMQYGFRKGMVAVVGLVLGFAAVAAPWIAMQKLVFGSATLVVDRVGHYNLFIGNNTDTVGWLSYPYPDGRGIEEKSMPALAKEAVAKNPKRWLQLMEDKPLRLFKFPWNDFRTPIGEVSFRWQVLAHQLIVILAAIGATLGLVATTKKTADYGYERPGRRPKDPTMARLFLLFVFGVHLAYLFFITVPRYNLTAMPIVIMFSAAGVSTLFKLFTMRGGSFAAVSIVFSLGLFFAGSDLDITSAFATAFGAKATVWGFVFKHALMTLSVIGLAAFLLTGISALSPKNPFESRRHPSVAYATLATLVCLGIALPLTIVPAAANGRWYEWKAPIDAGQVINQKIRLSLDDVRNLGNRQVYVMIDADGAPSLSGVTVQLDGRPLDAPIIPSIALNGDFERLQHSRGVNMREGEWIYSCMTESMPMRNSDMRQWFLLPLPPQTMHPGETTITLRKSGNTAGTIYGSYPSTKRARNIPSVNVASWEKAFYGVENNEGLSDPRYDTRIPASTTVDSDSDLSPSRGLQTGSYNIRLLASPAQVANTSLYTVELPSTSSVAEIGTHRIGSLTIADRSTRAFSVAEMQPYGPQDLWFVRCSGKVRRNAGAPTRLKLGIFANAADHPYSSPWTPSIQYGNEWVPFDFAVPLQPSALKSMRNLELSVSSAGTDSGITELSDLTVQILKAPSNPTYPGSFIL